MTSSKKAVSKAGFVLAGGKSSRMGTNKAFLEFGGQTLLVRALAVVEAGCGSATIVGDPATFAGFGPVLPDTFPGCGPLAGIHAALIRSSAELNFILAVDMPFVSADLIRCLLEKATGEPGAVVAVPRAQNRLQPLCAVYRRAFASHAEESLRAGRYKIDPLYRNVQTQVIDQQELASAGFLENDFRNVNTPEDCRAAANELSSSH